MRGNAHNDRTRSISGRQRRARRQFLSDSGSIESEPKDKRSGLRCAALRLVVAAVCAVAALAIHTGRASAFSYLCQQPAIGCISFSGYSGASVWGYPVDGTGNNCTNYAAFRLRQNGLPNPGNLGNAGSWAANARAKGFRVDQTPAVGAIAQWNYGSAYAPSSGHVAYVEQLTSTGFIETESNWRGPSRRVSFNRGDRYWPSDFIHFRDVGGGASNGDLYFIKTKNTGSGHVEVHSATAGSGYQSGQHSVSWFSPSDANNG